MRAFTSCRRCVVPLTQTRILRTTPTFSQTRWFSKGQTVITHKLDMEDIQPVQFELDLTNTEGTDLLKGTTDVAEQHGLLTSQEKELLDQAASLKTANNKQILKARLAKIIKEFQREEGDTGSTPVQIAILTEKLKNLDQVQHNKDKRGKRHKTRLWMRRRALLRYLRYQDSDTYEYLLKRLNIDRDELNNFGRSPDRQVLQVPVF